MAVNQTGRMPPPAQLGARLKASMAEPTCAADGYQIFFCLPHHPPAHETEPPAVFFRCDSAPFPTDAPDPIDESGDRTAEQQ